MVASHRRPISLAHAAENSEFLEGRAQDSRMGPDRGYLRASDGLHRLWNEIDILVSPLRLGVGFAALVGCRLARF
jgi:hypothetical protein